jgi:hypothetical protein
MNNLPAFICKTTTTNTSIYIDALEQLENKHVSDFALHTPINAMFTLLKER